MYVRSNIHSCSHNSKCKLKLIFIAVWTLNIILSKTTAMLKQQIIKHKMKCKPLLPLSRLISVECSYEQVMYIPTINISCKLYQIKSISRMAGHGRWIVHNYDGPMRWSLTSGITYRYILNYWFISRIGKKRNYGDCRCADFRGCLIRKCATWNLRYHTHSTNKKTCHPWISAVETHARDHACNRLPERYTCIATYQTVIRL